MVVRDRKGTPVTLQYRGENLADRYRHGVNRALRDDHRRHDAIRSVAHDDQDALASATTHLSLSDACDIGRSPDHVTYLAERSPSRDLQCRDEDFYDALRKADQAPQRVRRIRRRRDLSAIDQSRNRVDVVGVGEARPEDGLE